MHKPPAKSQERKLEVWFLGTSAVSQAPGSEVRSQKSVVESQKSDVLIPSTGCQCSVSEVGSLKSEIPHSDSLIASAGSQVPGSEVGNWKSDVGNSDFFFFCFSDF